jgi:hypothetical protein
MSFFYTKLHLQTLQGLSNNNEEETDSSNDSEVEVTSEINDFCLFIFSFIHDRK